MPLEIVRNDITTMKVDVIVNSAHPTAGVGGGVDFAIHQAAGPELLDERMKIGDIATGDAMVEQAIRLNPLHGSPYLLRAYRWMVAGEYEKAIDDYYCALVADPELVEFYFRIARAYRALGDSAALQQLKDKACALYRSLGRELRADEYYGLGEFDKACEKAAEDVTERSTQNTCYNTACIYALSGRNDEAVEYLRQAVEKGFLAIPHMNHDIDLDGLRAMPAFQQLMQECEAKTAEMRRIVDEQLTEDKQ